MVSKLLQPNKMSKRWGFDHQLIIFINKMPKPFHIRTLMIREIMV